LEFREDLQKSDSIVGGLGIIKVDTGHRFVGLGFVLEELGPRFWRAAMALSLSAAP